jgi:hypothetical protein
MEDKASSSFEIKYAAVIQLPNFFQPLLLVLVLVSNLVSMPRNERVGLLPSLLHSGKAFDRRSQLLCAQMQVILLLLSKRLSSRSMRILEKRSSAESSNLLALRKKSR